jgi:hypothetical protein
MIKKIDNLGYKGEISLPSLSILNTLGFYIT